MTARGPNANHIPALPQPDPTLETRPVPRERPLNIQWLGPGADPDIRQQVRSVKEIDQQPTESGFQEPIGNSQKYWVYWAQHFLGQIIRDGELDWHKDGLDFVPDPTWGLSIIITSYSDPAHRRLEGAVLNLIETVRHYFLANTNRSCTAYGGEAFKHFKLGVIQDKEFFEDASDDRVREEYNAHIRSLNGSTVPATEYDELCAKRVNPDGYNRPTAPPRLDPCIALDEAKMRSYQHSPFKMIGRKIVRLFAT